MNFSTNWRDRRTVFSPMHYSIANYSTETKNDMKTSFGEDLFLNNLHLIPDPLMKNLADTIITEEKMAPKSKLDNNIGVETNTNMHNIQPDYSPLSGITNFLSGVINVISNAMFSKRKQTDFSAENSPQMTAPSMWHGAKVSDENKILLDENRSDDMAELLVSEMTDCRKAAAHCQNKIEQVRLLLGSKPVPCTFRSRRRPKRVFVEAGSVEDCFEDAFAPEDFENIANDSIMQYSSPICYHEHVFHEIDGPKVKVEKAESPKMVPEPALINETTEIIKNVPEIETAKDIKSECDSKKELVASCEDKISKLKALLQDRKKKPQIIIEPEPVSLPETKETTKPKTVPKVKDKRFKNPNRTCGKRMKSKMKKNIQDDLLFANEVNSEDLSSVENSPCMENFEKYIQTQPKSDKDYFDEVSGRFHSASVTDSEDSFQIVFNDSPKPRRASDCESEDSFIVFEDSPDSCYTSNDIFGDSSDSEEYNSDSDLSDSGCGNMSFKLAASLSKSVCNLADDSLYVDPSEDEVDCAKVPEVDVSEKVTGDLVGDVKAGVLIDDDKKLLRKHLPAKRVQFSEKPPKVHVMRVWAYAARQARAGHWETYARDRDRFKRRIADVDMAVSWVLKPQHRSRVMFQRFMPWWNAQKRKELAEKKEKEAQEKLRRDEEAEVLKLEEERRNLNNDEIAEVGDKNTLLSTEENRQLNSLQEKEGETNRKKEKSSEEKLDTDAKVNGELRAEEIIKNNINETGSPNNEHMQKCNYLENNTKAPDTNVKNEIYCNELNETEYTTRNNHTISQNDKITDLQNECVIQNVLNT